MGDAGPSPSAEYDAVLYLRPGGFESPRGSSDQSTGCLFEGDESGLPACAFLESLRMGVAASKKMAKRHKNLAIFPFRGFSHTARLIDHTKQVPRKGSKSARCRIPGTSARFGVV